MKPSEDQWNRWIDGELSDEDLAAMEASAKQDAEMEGEPAFFSRLNEDLRRAIPAEQDPPFADFFNSQLHKRIRDLDAPPETPEGEPSWKDWLRLSWMLPLAGAAALVVALAQIGMFGSHVSHSQIVYAYTPDEAVHAETSFDRGVQRHGDSAVRRCSNSRGN